jgi:hypothetical protein
MNPEEAAKQLAELRNTNGPVDPDDLEKVWSALETVHIKDILGQWRGTAFDTGHPGFGMLDAIRWYGKRFTSYLDAEPVLCHDEDGNLYSNLDAGGGGTASLWMIEYQGELTAGMVYDALPTVDHFKRVDDDTLFGVMDGKGEIIRHEGKPFYFVLERA